MSISWILESQLDEFLIDACQEVGADRSPTRLLVDVSMLRPSSFFARDWMRLTKLPGTFPRHRLSQLYHEAFYSLQSLYLTTGALWMAYHARKQRCMSSRIHRWPRYTQNGRLRIKLKLALCASFHFILEFSWMRWGS